MNQNDDAEQSTLSRRTILKAAAWAAPVVAVAVAVPMASASTNLEITPISGDVQGRQITFAGVESGGLAPLVFEVADNGQSFIGSATATLVGADGIAVWSPSPDDDTLITSTDEWGLFLPVEVIAHGSFTLNISIGGQTEIYTVVLEA